MPLRLDIKVRGRCTQPPAWFASCTCTPGFLTSINQSDPNVYSPWPWQRKLSSHSDRVKSVDIHPTEPWVLSAMYNGHMFLWNYNTQGLVKSFEVSDQPVRAGKFVPRKQWIIAGSDDMQVRVTGTGTVTSAITGAGTMVQVL